MTEQKNRHRRFDIKNWLNIMLLIKGISNLFKPPNKRKKERKYKTYKNITFDDQNEKIEIEEENNKDGSFKKNSKIQEISDKKSNEIKSFFSEKTKKDNNEIDKLGNDLEKNLIIGEKKEIKTKIDLIVDDESDVDNCTNDDENQDSEHTEDVSSNNSNVGGSVRRNIVEIDFENDDGDSESISGLEELIDQCTIVDKGPTRQRSENNNNNRFIPYQNRTQTSESIGELSNQNNYHYTLCNNHQEASVLNNFNPINYQPTTSFSVDNFNNNIGPQQNNWQFLQPNDENENQQNTFNTIPPTINDNQNGALHQEHSNNSCDSHISQFSVDQITPLINESVFTDLVNYLSEISQKKIDINLKGQPATPTEAAEMVFVLNSLQASLPAPLNSHNNNTTNMPEVHLTPTPEAGLPLDVLEKNSSDLTSYLTPLNIHNNNATILSEEHQTLTQEADLTFDFRQINSSTTQTSQASPSNHNNNATIMPEKPITPTWEVDVILDFCKQILRQNQFNQVKHSHVPKNILYKVARNYCKTRLSANYKHNNIVFQNLLILMEKQKGNEKSLNRELNRIKHFFEAKYLFWDEHLFEQRDRNNFNLLERILSEQSNCYLLEFYVVFNAIWKLEYPTRTRILNNSTKYITGFLESCDNDGHRDFIQTLLETAQGPTII